jgi:uncharacterized C2H2 Zn-finger protein
MFILFGTKWQVEPVKPLIDTYCYNCNVIRTWDLYAQREYFTLFFIPTIAFRSEYFLVCKKCNDQYDIDKDFYKRINSRHKTNKKQSLQLHDELVKKLEAHQLAGKTEEQIRYIKSVLKTKS